MSTNCQYLDKDGNLHNTLVLNSGDCKGVGTSAFNSSLPIYTCSVVNNLGESGGTFATLTAEDCAGYCGNQAGAFIKCTACPSSGGACTTTTNTATYS